MAGKAGAKGAQRLLNQRKVRSKVQHQLLVRPATLDRREEVNAAAEKEAPKGGWLTVGNAADEGANEVVRSTGVPLQPDVQLSAHCSEKVLQLTEVHSAGKGQRREAAQLGEQPLSDEWQTEGQAATSAGSSSSQVNVSEKEVNRFGFSAPGGVRP